MERSGASGGQRGTETMHSSSLPSPEIASSDDAMLRRFVEASRRAEIIALVNSARTEGELAEVVTAELCEAYEAEIAFLMTARADGGLPEVVGSAGLPAGAGGGPLQEGFCIAALFWTAPQLYARTVLLRLCAL